MAPPSSDTCLLRHHALVPQPPAQRGGHDARESRLEQKFPCFLSKEKARRMPPDRGRGELPPSGDRVDPESWELHGGPCRLVVSAKGGGEVNELSALSLVSMTISCQSDRGSGGEAGSDWLIAH